MKSTKKIVSAAAITAAIAMSMSITALASPGHHRAAAGGSTSGYSYGYCGLSDHEYDSNGLCIAEGHNHEYDSNGYCISEDHNHQYGSNGQGHGCRRR